MEFQSGQNCFTEKTMFYIQNAQGHCAMAYRNTQTLWYSTNAETPCSNAV